MTAKSSLPMLSINTSKTENQKGNKEQKHKGLKWKSLNQTGKLISKGNSYVIY